MDWLLLAILSAANIAIGIDRGAKGQTFSSVRAWFIGLACGAAAIAALTR